MTRSLKWLLLVLCLSTLPLIPLQAQQTNGAITGIVTDPSGDVVASAFGTVTNTVTGLARAVSIDIQDVHADPEPQPSAPDRGWILLRTVSEAVQQESGIIREKSPGRCDVTSK